MRKVSFICLLFLLAGNYVTSQRTFSLQTSLGPIRGNILHVNGTSAGVFQAIPYAQPPIGRLRFRPPVPPRPWSPQSLDATNGYSSVCPQMGMMPSRNPESEDCLYLNVFTPITSSQSRERLPVMLFIHGGGFALGSASMEKEGLIRQFVSRRVVLVTINYRLGPLGVYSPWSAADGNNGMLDVIQALRWTKNEIANFGGAPNKVTVFGASAGGIAVSILQMSPLAVGLFEQGGEISGTALNERSATIDPGRLYNRSMILNRKLGCAFPSIAQILQCMQRVPLTQLMKEARPNPVSYTLCTQTAKKDVPAYWGPVWNSPLMPGEPKEWIKRYNNAQIMMEGTNSEEAGFMEMMPLLRGGTQPVVKSAQQMRDKTFAENLNTFNFFKNPTLVKAAAEREYITNANPPFQSQQAEVYWFDRNVQFLTDLTWHSNAAMEASESFKRGVTVYLYEMSYPASQTILGFPWKGSIHGSEMQLLFDQPDRAMRGGPPGGPGGPGGRPGGPPGGAAGGPPDGFQGFLQGGAGGPSGPPPGNGPGLILPAGSAPQTGLPSSQQPDSAEVRQMKQMLADMWTNFAKYGQEYGWEPFESMKRREGRRGRWDGVCDRLFANYVSI